MLGQLKRQHSAEPLNINSRKSPGSIGTTSLGATPPTETEGPVPAPTLPNSVFSSTSLPDDSVVGSPLKKHRGSLQDMDNETMQKRLGMGIGSGFGGHLVSATEAAHAPLLEPGMKDTGMDELRIMNDDDWHIKSSQS